MSPESKVEKETREQRKIREEAIRDVMLVINNNGNNTNAFERLTRIVQAHTGLKMGEGLDIQVYSGDSEFDFLASMIIAMANKLYEQNTKNETNPSVSLVTTSASNGSISAAPKLLALSKDMKSVLSLDEDDSEDLSVATKESPSDLTLIALPTFL